MWLLDQLITKKNSDSIAVVHREERLSYAELWRKSEVLASYLEKICHDKAPVVIYGNKDLEIICIMIACLKTGRAYVPLDITYPQKRVCDIIREVEAEIVFNFTDVNLEELNKVLILSKTQTEGIIETTPLEKEIAREKYVGLHDNCYILFTSGSTGKAKGVQISRENISNFVGWFKKECIYDHQDDVVMNQVSYSFDVSVIPLYIFLGEGLTLYTVDKEMLDNTRILFQYLKQSGVSIWVSTPAFMEICCFDSSFNEELLPKLRKIVLAGEVLTKQLVSAMQSKFPKAEIINGYGPTEGTVLLSSCVITEEMIKSERSLPIGKVFDEAEYQILDAEGRIVSEGEIGELCVSSKSISKGYFKNPDQTKKVFYKNESGMQSYRTGDLVFEENGWIYYVARKDMQIKLNGYRIELNDIAENLNSLEIINNNIVLPVYKDEKVSYLAAFATLNQRPEQLSDLKVGLEIKKMLKQRIPSYMIPKKIIILDVFPMNIKRN